jgi:hypothetical protein
MGASPSVTSRKLKPDSFLVEEQKQKFQNNIIQTGVDYCREHLFTESPMSVTRAGDNLMILRVDQSRLEEMTNPEIGRIGAPYLVTLNTLTGNMVVQLFPDKRPPAHRQSSLDPGSCQPSSPGLVIGDEATSTPRTPNSATSSLTPLASPTQLPKNQHSNSSPNPSPVARSRSSSRRPISRQPSTPTLLKPPPLQNFLGSKKRVIFGAAMMAPKAVPRPPSTPRMVEQSPNHITVEV